MKKRFSQYAQYGRNSLWNMSILIGLKQKDYDDYCIISWLVCWRDWLEMFLKDLEGMAHYAMLIVSQKN